MGTPARELTASTAKETSGYFFITSQISRSGLKRPVDVSLETSVRQSYFPVESSLSISSGRLGWPHSTPYLSASLPFSSAMSNHRSEKLPHVQERTRLPHRLRSAPSIAPVELEVNRYTWPFSVPSIFRRPALALEWIFW